MIKKFMDIESFFKKRMIYGIKPGLDRMEKLLYLAGNPHLKFKSIHITGTNGKGSTATYLKNTLMNNGYQVGVFQSPSLTGITGYIIKNNNFITEEKFLSLFNQLFPAIKQLDHENNHPTEFEAITAIAFMYFATTNVDIALIETGMGGKEDTTNLIKPILSIITNVEKDHSSFLGNTIEEIAAHKAGIIKPHTPVVIGEMKDEAQRVIVQQAQENDAPLYELHKQFHYEINNHSYDGYEYRWYANDPDEENIDVQLKMIGEHQVKNSSLSLMILSLLKEHGFTFKKENILESLKKTFIPGRFEIIQKEPLIVLDGAHNPAGIKAFIETLNMDQSKKKKHLLFAAFKDKELEHMLSFVTPYFDSITLTTFHNKRAAKADELYHLTDHPNKQIENNWKNFFPTYRNKDDHYYVSGSMAFIGEVRRFILHSKK